MKAIEFYNYLMRASDKEVQAFVLKNTNIELSIGEVKQLRPLMAGANVSWIFSGIPKSVLKDAEKVIGKSKLKKFMKLIE
ncbi:hypothetical protein [Solibacillus sp. CAU 1738]|uniref:hypothetical protein n=1 Tax=Solibacillus sp. CAU 1738 TaxID=3140363 RepID=UPI0032607F56